MGIPRSERVIEIEDRIACVRKTNQLPRVDLLVHDDPPAAVNVDDRGTLRTAGLRRNELDGLGRIGTVPMCGNRRRSLRKGTKPIDEGEQEPEEARHHELSFPSKAEGRGCERMIHDRDAKLYHALF